MDTLDLLIYLDEFLTKNLNSLVINGYIEKRTSRWIEDRTLSGRAHVENKEQYYDEDRYIKDERDGYKGKNNTRASTKTDSFGDDKVLEGRNFVRREEELTRIYTSFELHQQLLNGLNDSSLIKNMDSGNINEGDYVQVLGKISPESIISYLDVSSNIINSCGTSNLNTFLSNSNNLNTGALNINNLNANYDFLINQYSYIRNMLTYNNTQDILLKANGKDVIVSVNNNYFLNSSNNIYDKINCNCKVIGKVIKVCDSSESINLLRKTGHPEYFEKLLNKLSSLNNVLNDNGLELPEMPRCNICEEPILIIPISICI